LQFWDYCIAGLFAIMVYTFLVSNRQEAPQIAFQAFIVASLSTLISLPFTVVSWKIRFHGTFANPNDFAAFCLLLILLGLFLFERETNRREKIVIAVLLSGLGLCLVFSHSRGAFLAATVIFVLYLWKQRPPRQVVIGILLLFILGTGILVFRFAGPLDPFAYYRLKIWKRSLVGVLENPYLGTGLNMLQYQAARFNFPADHELGRYARIAKTADSQYLQILAETGFLGFLTFLTGWIALYLFLRKLPKSCMILIYSFYAISIIAFVSLPFHNTAITFLFLFLIIFPIPFDPLSKPIYAPLSFPGKLAATTLLILMFLLLVFFPYAAYREMRAVSRSPDLKSAEQHLAKAIQYNPYQPYYRFSFVRSIVAARPSLKPEQWLSLANMLNQSIRLNPMEADFYAYRAKIYAALLALTRQSDHYSQAVSSYQAALDHAPFNVFLRTDYGYFLYQVGRLDLARNEMQKVIETEPAYLNARLLLAEIKLKENDLEGARRELSEFERFYERYRTIEPAADQTYIRKLLQVNPEKRAELRRLTSSAANTRN
jgi:hypothetical protein